MNWLSSILSFKCPRCRQGNMFPKGILYNPKKFSKMNKSCSVCEQSFEPEPGYYFGAMFISYGFNAAYFAITWILLSIILDDVTAMNMIWVLAVVIVLLLPFTFRLSRVLWINIFVRFDKSRIDSTKK